MTIHSRFLSRAFKKGCAAVATVLLYAGIGATLQGCITATPPPPPGACVPTVATDYKGGDAFGEELKVHFDPATLGYSVTIEASLQRAPASPVVPLTGTLTALSGCTFASDENGAQFTFGDNGVLLGGVRAPSGGSFLPLLAFQNTFAAAAPGSTAFSSVSGVFNITGVQYSGSTGTGYKASGRLRNAGTFQLCQDPTAGFILYASGCASTVNGPALAYNSTRNAYDVTTTTPSDGSLNGSMVIGLVGTDSVPVMLVRGSNSSYGMRVFHSIQQTSGLVGIPLVPGSVNGNFAVVNTSGTNTTASISGVNGETLTQGATTSTLTYDTPTFGVIEAKSGATTIGHVLAGRGLYSFVPESGTPVFSLGVFE